MYKFVFDLDSTITKEELLPMIAKHIGIYEKILSMTKNAMQGNDNFEQNFKSRISLINDLKIEDIQNITKNASLNPYIVRFIKENKNRCIIVTGNLYEIIYPILKTLDMEDKCYCSIANVINNKIVSVEKVINKKDIVSKFNFPFVAIGDGANDIDMLRLANVGIAYGNKYNLHRELIKVSNHIFDDDKKLYKFLNTLL